jgi:hypothetical protein
MNEIMTMQGITIPDETTQEQWAEIHRTILTAKRASSKWVSQSRKWASERWGIDFVAETEVQLELSLGIEHADKPANLNPPDKSRAIVTIEGIGQSFQMWWRKMHDDMRQWDKDRLDRFIDIMKPQGEALNEAIELRSKLGQGEGG